ncbi:MAG: PEP-CTERM sorting domain-containing protein [Pseudomonadota bacterium]
MDFDAVASGTAFASGSGTGGLTFSYAIAGPSTLQVADSFGTTSGSHYLGLDNPDTAFYLGDSFTINFNRSVHAAGLYLIAGGDTQAGDLAMSVPGHTVFNAATPDALVSDGNAYYLGLVDSGAGFSSVTVYGVPSAGAFLAFTADDITSAVPEPASAWLLLAGLATLLPLQRRRSR